VSERPSTLDDLSRQFDQQFQEVERVEDAIIEIRNLPRGMAVGVRIAEPASPRDLICAFGPCRHYLSQVTHLPTENEDKSSDGVLHSQRSHYCAKFAREIEDDYVYDCDAWAPRAWRRAVMRLRGETRKKRLAKITAPVTNVVGYFTCRVCRHDRERSGVINVIDREASGRRPGEFCWCGERAVPMSWEQGA